MGSNKGFDNTNKLANENFANYNQQRNDFGNTLSGGFGQAQGNSQNAFNSAYGGYNDLLKQLAGGSMPGGGGGGVNLSNAIATLQGISGPGNPWAGQLGTDIRTRNDSILPGFYDRIRSEQGRLQNIQGGYNPGYTSQMSKLARDQAQQAQAAKLSGDVTIGEKSAAAQAAQAAFAAQQAGGIAQLQAQQAMANASGGRASADSAMRARLAALGGLTELRGQTPGEVNLYMQGMLGNMGQGQQFAQQGLAQMYGNNPQQKPWWQQALGAAGQGAGIASLFMGGGGGGRGGGKGGGGNGLNSMRGGGG